MMMTKRIGWSRYVGIARRLSRELLVEFRRLNSARMGDAHLSRLSPRERARAVKAALATHHSKNARCC